MNVIEPDSADIPRLNSAMPRMCICYFTFHQLFGYIKIPALLFSRFVMFHRFNPTHFGIGTKSRFYLAKNIFSINISTDLFPMIPVLNNYFSLFHRTVSVINYNWVVFLTDFWKKLSSMSTKFCRKEAIKNFNPRHWLVTHATFPKIICYYSLLFDM